MLKHNITHILGVDVAFAAAAGGTTAVNGNVIDTQGYESIVVLVQFGAITAGAETAIKLQAGDQADGSDMADVPGSTVAVPVAAATKGMLSAELHRPRKRYVRPVVTRATQNAAIAGGVALLGRSGVQPPILGARIQSHDVPILISQP